MALPTILVDSATGSDTQASGAGPAIALFGTTDASFSGAVVTLTASTDLSGVATDGSHVLYLLTSTGVRFFKITAKDDGADTVTVTPNPAGTSTGRSWAIGGKLASIGSSSSKLLIENGGTSGDAMPGWTIEMASGHTEATITGTISFYRAGDTTDGYITLKGVDGAATLPLLTFSNDGIGFDLRGAMQKLDNFEMRNSAVGKTASIGIRTVVSQPMAITRMKVSHSSNYFRKGISSGGSGNLIRGCDVGYCSNIGIENTGDYTAILWNYAHNCTSDGISTNTTRTQVIGNICYSNGGKGINATGLQSKIIHNTCDSNTSDGIYQATTNTLQLCINNLVTNNSGYGIQVSGASLAAIAIGGSYFFGNATYNNTSGACNIAGLLLNDPNANPSYTAASSGNFAVGTGVKAKGHPLAGTFYVGGTSATYSYIEPGAAQREEAGGGGGGALHLGGLGQTGIGSF
jgi:hypothetical protein